MKPTLSLAGFALLLTPLWMGASDCEVAVVDHDQPGDDAGPGGDGDGPAACEVEGVSHKVGETFALSDGCNSCKCEADGSPSCTKHDCGVSCEFEGKVYHAGESWADGCTQCSCGAEGKVSCLEVPCDPVGCTYNGKEHALGDTFMDDCHSCLCNKDGKVSCAAEVCPGSCTMGNATFANGESVLCADGCNNCGCVDGSWSMTDASCSPVPGIEVCDDDFSTQESPVYLVGPVLALDLTYGGGCQEHTFKLCYDGSLRESNPVQVGLYAIDLNENDPCDATPTKQVVFDLTPLAKAYEKAYATGQGTIVLQVGGQSLPFSFSEPSP